MPQTVVYTPSPADVFIARLLSGGRIATVRQITHVLVRHYGYSLRNTMARLARMQRSLLLQSRPIDPHRGRASQRALALTARGTSLTATSADWVDLSAIGREDMEHAAQRFELGIWMLDEGWQSVSARDLPEALRTAALARYRGRALTSSDAQDRRLLERAPLPPLRLSGLRHPDTGEVRIIIEVTAGVYLRTRVNALDAYRICDPLKLELVGWNQFRVRDAIHYIEKWARGRRRVNGRWRPSRNREMTTHYIGSYGARGPVEEG